MLSLSLWWRRNVPSTVPKIRTDLSTIVSFEGRSHINALEWEVSTTKRKDSVTIEGRVGLISICSSGGLMLTFKDCQNSGDRLRELGFGVEKHDSARTGCKIFTAIQENTSKYQQISHRQLGSHLCCCRLRCWMSQRSTGNRSSLA